MQHRQYNTTRKENSNLSRRHIVFCQKRQYETLFVVNQDAKSEFAGKTGLIAEQWDNS